MSSFWNGYIVILTLINIAACWWLLRWTAKKRPGEAAESDVTGHKWDDDLEEFNNPLPRWWLYMFYLTIIFSLVYLMLYPGLGNYAGALGWTSTGQHQVEVLKADNRYNEIFQRYAKQPLDELAKDEEAMEIGNRLFGNNCATCHGADANGASGFPNLADNDWLYGGEPETIKTSISGGRAGVMPGWEAALGTDGVGNVTAYVRSLSGSTTDATAVSAGKTQYAAMCAACHGADGKGTSALGAPNLTDDIWLYGGSAESINQTIAKGRNGQMPAHAELLGEDKIHILAAYIYSLSGDASGK